jgi:hypothetical protein
MEGEYQMSQLLVIYYFSKEPPMCDVRDISSLSDLDIIIQEETHESVSFDDGLKKIEFFVRTSGKVLNQFVLSKVVEM